MMRTVRTILIGCVAAGILCVLSCGSSAEQDYAWGLKYYDEGRYDKALELWRPVAEAGHGQAQRNLGVMFYLGQGVEQDYGQAHTWLQRSAEQGTGEVALKLAAMYANGHGAEQDLVKAYTWVCLALDEGDPEAETWRTSLSRQMSAEQIAEATARADAWQPTR